MSEFSEISSDRRADELSDLHSQIHALTVERDDLKLKLAQSEAANEGLRKTFSLWQEQSARVAKALRLKSDEWTHDTDFIAPIQKLQKDSTNLSKLLHPRNAQQALAQLRKLKP